jgi:hypothetical protein
LIVGRRVVLFFALPRFEREFAQKALLESIHNGA